MSYAGMYGEDETCPCGTYWRSCMNGHSLTGPNPKPGDLERALERRGQEIQEAREREAERGKAYDCLDPLERVIAEALWSSHRKKYPGITETLPNAVRGIFDDGMRNSGAIGEARGICGKAKVVAVAVSESTEGR